MACKLTFPTYFPPEKVGLKTINSKGDGYTMLLSWFRAYEDVFGYKVAYNIYYSTELGDVFKEGPKFVSTNVTGLCATLIDFLPGDMWYFSVRATEYDPAWYNLELLPDGPTDYLKVYPESLLTSDISDTDLSIPISDIDLFPPYGIVQIGYEYIRYYSKDVGNNLLLVQSVDDRGFLSTNPRLHTVDGYDGVLTHDNAAVIFFKGCEEQNTNVAQEHVYINDPYYARTNADGYKEKVDLITTDLSSTDEAREDFRSYGYAGWHRVDPDLFFKGVCAGSYIGGEYFCADGYGGVARQIRNISLSEQADMREEFQLERTGETVVFVRRLWSGIVCPCYEANREHPEHRCHVCFVPGTLVRTIEGLKEIQNIKIGEMVLSSDGTYQLVTKVMESDYKGDLSSILSSTSTTPILSTPEHPFKVMRGSHKVKNGCSALCNSFINKSDGLNIRSPSASQRPNGKWWARAAGPNLKRMSLGVFENKNDAISVVEKYRLDNYKPGHELQWDDAKNIKKGDYLVSKWNKSIFDINKINIPEKYQKNTKLGSERNGVTEFVVDNDFLWMIGLYLAEGSSGSRSINFSLHKDETEYQQRIVNFFKKYGFNSSIFVRGNGANVCVYSTSLANWFPDWLGKKCYNKRIPEEFMSLPPEKAWALFNGVYDGDGTKSELEIGQTSEVLAMQLIELLHRLGKQPLVRRQIANTLTPKGNKRRVAYVVSWEKDDFHHESRSGRWAYKDELLSRVVKTDKIPYNGKVYNLEVQGNHTYVVGNTVVHNCYGTGFTTGYQQYFNSRRSDGRILVRFDPASEDLKMEDAGLESSVILNCWTLSTPAIKDRDFIIRFNTDGTEEFRYEILDVTRNKLFYGEYGKQLFKVQRVRKTDPINMWRPLRDAGGTPIDVSTSIGFTPGPGGIVPHTHTVTIPSGVTSIAQINHTTNIAAGHNHPIINGEIIEVAGHTHTIIL